MMAQHCRYVGLPQVCLPDRFGSVIQHVDLLVRGDRDSRATLMPIYGDLYQIKL